MKYVLKKDLPFAKAGVEAFVDFENDVYIKEVPTLQCAIYSGKTWLGDIQSLIKLGWIEEVKPRDYFISLKQDGTSKWWLNDVAEFREDLKDGGLYKIIKVREVIE